MTERCTGGARSIYRSTLSGCLSVFKAHRKGKWFAGDVQRLPHEKSAHPVGQQRPEWFDICICYTVCVEGSVYWETFDTVPCSRTLNQTIDLDRDAVYRTLGTANHTTMQNHLDNCLHFCAASKQSRRDGCNLHNPSNPRTQQHRFGVFFLHVLSRHSSGRKKATHSRV